MNVIKQKLPIVSSDPIDARPVAIYVHGLASGTAGTTFCSLARKNSNIIDGLQLILDESDNPECPVLTIETETAWTRVCQI